MILADAVARSVAAGDVSVVFRRWTTSRVRAGSTLRTTAGVVAVDGVEEVDPAGITAADAAASGHDSVAALLASVPDGPGLRLFRIRVSRHGPDPRIDLAATPPTPEEVEQIAASLRRLDDRSPRGPWTRTALETVAAHPARRAGDLADLLGREKDALKVDIRKLKGLGLTRSLEVGFRLSPRGEAYLLATRY